MKVFVDCTGCELRKIDAQKIINYFRANSITVTRNPKESDYAIVVTCAVDHSNIDTAIDRIKVLEGQIGKKTRLIIGGCLPSISPSELSSFNIFQTFSPRNMDILDNIFWYSEDFISINELTTPNRSLFDVNSLGDIESTSSRKDYDIAKNGFRIILDEGCLLNCSYCVIRKATGKLKSKPVKEILEEFEQGLKEKQKTIMLMGGDTGAYGIDIGIRLYDLLERLLEYDGDHKIFLHDFNINWLLKDIGAYLHIFEKSEQCQRIKAVNFPIQSGSNRILKLMERPYQFQGIIDSLRSVRKSGPSIKIGTHIILGFPGEMAGDFDETVKLLSEFSFDFVTCFSYSDNPLAKSALLPNKVSRDVIASRIEILHNLMEDRIKFLGF